MVTPFLPESAQSPEPEIPKYISGEDLVGLIAHAGPGARLKVRSHFVPDGTTKVGLTTWMSDFTKGPAVYYYRDPRKHDYIDGILPLGGETVIMSPPKINTMRGDRRILPLIEGGYRNPVYRHPIDPVVEEKYLFEVLADDDITPEEAATIQALEQAASIEATP